jgi:hypothetical protein
MEFGEQTDSAKCNLEENLFRCAISRNHHCSLRLLAFVFQHHPGRVMMTGARLKPLSEQRDGQKRPTTEALADLGWKSRI